MNTMHRQPLFETRFLSDGPQEFPRQSIIARLLREALALAAVGSAIAVLIGWLVR